MTFDSLKMWLLTYRDIVSTYDDFYILEVEKKLEKLHWYPDQPESIKCAIIAMIFVMGFQKVLSIKNFIKFISNREYKYAAMEFLRCSWARKVGKRANDIALEIRNCENL